MEYRYVGYSLDEGIVKGKIEADDEPTAREDITDKGYKVLEFKAVKQLPGMEDLFPSLFKIGSKDLVRFTQQLAIMVRGGGSLQRALELLESETRNRVLRRVLASIIKSLNEGGSLSGAMALHPTVFSSRFTSVVGAGEHTGRLPPALDQLASIMEKEQAAKQKAKQTMMMPMFTIGASAVMLVLMLTVLLPPLLETFTRMGSEIPLITRIAMGLIGGFSTYFKYVMIVVGAIVALFWLSKRMPTLEYALHNIQIHTPILGQMLMAGELSQFSRTISMLLESGIPLATALPLGITGTKNAVIRQAFVSSEESLVAGHGLSDALKDCSILPRMWVELVLIGEESNTLDQTLKELADAYQKELENRLGSLLAMLEPLSTLAVGGIVLFIALSMFLPIYSGLNAVG